MIDAWLIYLYENSAKISALFVFLSGVCFAVYRAMYNIFAWKSYAEKSFQMQEAIFKEFRTNGGTSFTDKINRIEKAVEGISEKLLRQESIRKGYRRFLPTPIWESAVDGKCLAANLAIQKLTGTPEQDFLNNNWQVFIHKDDREKVYVEWMHAIEQKRIFNMQYRVVNQDDKKVYKVHAYTVAIENLNKEPIGWIGWYETVEEIKNEQDS